MENQTRRSHTRAKMQFASALTTAVDADEASSEITDQITEAMNGLDIHLALIFLSPHFRATAADVVETLRERLKPSVMLGCTAEGVIGCSREIERSSAMTVIAAHLPAVELEPFVLQAVRWDSFLGDVNALKRIVPVTTSTKLVMLLADPFTTPADTILNTFNAFFPDVPMVGGMASGSTRAGGNALVMNDRLLNNGAVGVSFSGDFEVDVIVSQGCRPIGDPLVVTGAKQNLVFSLDGKSPLAHLQQLLRQISESDRQLLENGLFLGRAIAPSQERLGRGDFLVRGVLGIDQQNGALVVADYVNEGETVQFQVRDASTAEEDLEMMLTPQLFYDKPSGGLLFSCNGRGTRLYGHPDGDITTIRKVIGDVNLVGFFCAGEIGPIGGRNFLHGHTASLALFRPRSRRME